RTGGLPSTIVDCTGAEPVVLRLGALSADQLREVLGTTTLHDSPAARDAARDAAREAEGDPATAPGTPAADEDSHAAGTDSGAGGTGSGAADAPDCTADGAATADRARLVGSLVPSGVSVPPGSLRTLAP